MGIFIFKTLPRCCLSRTESCYSLFIIESKSFFFFFSELAFIEQSTHLTAKLDFIQCLPIGRCWEDP